MVRTSIVPEKKGKFFPIMGMRTDIIKEFGVIIKVVNKY